MVTLGLTSFGVSVAAQSSASVVPPVNEIKTELDSGGFNKKFDEDKRITDIELKAQGGSLSRYSLKFDLAFQGPAVDRLYDVNQPNPDNRPRPNHTNLSGYLGLRYRLSSVAALNASTGLKWYTPYQSVAGEKVPKRKGDQDFELANPQISYDRNYALGAAQMRTSLRTQVITQPYYIQAGEFGGVGASQAVKYNIERLIFGSQIDADVYLYNRAYLEKEQGRAVIQLGVMAEAVR